MTDEIGRRESHDRLLREALEACVSELGNHCAGTAIACYRVSPCSACVAVADGKAALKAYDEFVAAERDAQAEFYEEVARNQR